MKGLLIKDFYTLLNQVKLYTICILLISTIPGISLITFAIIYAAMLPMTALAYDERVKWDSYAVMLPYSEKDIVISKYVFGYCAMFSIAVLTFLANQILMFVKSGNVAISGETIFLIMLSICMGTAYLSVNLPASFYFGVEKGRLFLLFSTAMMVAAGMIFSKTILYEVKKIEVFGPVFILVITVSTVLVNLLSMIFSIKIYKRKKESVRK